jgi:hypothetical protein
LLKSIWGLISLASGFYVLATVTTFLLPDTLSITKAESTHHRTSNRQETDVAPPESSSTVKESLRRIRQGMKDILSFMAGNGLVIIMMFCHVFVAISKVVQVMLLQYTTKRYHWSWSKVGIL